LVSIILKTLLFLKQKKNSENDSLNKSKKYLNSKIEDFEEKEADLMGQINKYADLVKHLEMQTSQAVAEKEQAVLEKHNSDKRIESLIEDFNGRLSKERETALRDIDKQIRLLTDQVNLFDLSPFFSILLNQTILF
jgi:sulfur carrier protein ThiS